MELVQSISSLIGGMLLQMFATPLFLFIYMLLIVLVGCQYRQVERISAALINHHKQLYLRSALVSALIGMLGGIVGSFLIILVGIDITSVGIFYLWLTAVFLMLINPRYLCFAYAGGLLSVFNLLFGYPHISIPQLMGLVAVLHMVESLLILLNGSYNAAPVYIQKSGLICGGFNLQKFWPLPLIALASTSIPASGTGLYMPEWWPLLNIYPGCVKGHTYTLFPVLAVLGYGEITTTALPQQRVRQSSFKLFIFSLTLLLFAILASKWPFFMVAAALFSPLGHELVIWSGLKQEIKHRPLFIPPGQGVMVLDIKPSSTAQKFGLKPGDIILSINQHMLNSYRQMNNMLIAGNSKLYLHIQRGSSKIYKEMLSPSETQIGIIPVPEKGEMKYLNFAEQNLLDRILKQVRR